MYRRVDVLRDDAHSRTVHIDWIPMLRKDGAPIHSRMLALQARDVVAEHGIEDFFASWHWRDRSKQRSNLSLHARARRGQVTPADAGATAKRFGTEVQELLLQLGVSKVYNADQSWLVHDVCN